MTARPANQAMLMLAMATAMLGLSCAGLNPPPRPAAAPVSGQPLPDILPYDEPPVPVTTVQPVYPEFAKEAQISGTVVLHLLVGKDGRVGKVIVARGITGLNDAAIDAVRHWVFKPALKDQAPVESWYESDLDFELP